MQYAKPRKIPVKRKNIRSRTGWENGRTHMVNMYTFLLFFFGKPSNKNFCWSFLLPSAHSAEHIKIFAGGPCDARAVLHKKS